MSFRPRPNLPCDFSRGFSLVEVVLSLGIAAFALIAIFGLLPVGLTSNRDSIDQSAASQLAVLLDEDLRSTKSGALTPVFQIPVPPPPILTQTASAPLYFQDGAEKTASPTESAFRVVCLFGPASGHEAIPVTISITWPASVPAETARGRFESVTMVPGAEDR